VPSLFVIQGSDQGSRFEFDEPTIRLGRDHSNRVQLHDTEVSRQHAEIRHEEDGFVLVDLGSSNGTFVNGRRIERHRLASGDHLQLGRTLILYTGPSADFDEDLAQAIDIAATRPAEDASRIIHSVTQADGSRLFEPGDEAPQDAWLARARNNLRVMYNTALAASHTLDIDQLLSRIMELIFESVEADRGCVMLVDPESRQLEPKVRRVRGQPAGRAPRDAPRITISKTILDYVIGRNEGVLTSDARQDQRWTPAASILQAGTREAICVPMQGRYDVVGVIYVDTFTSPQEVIRKGGAPKFTEDHLKLLIAIAHQAALAVEDTQYYSAMVQAERLAAIGQTVAMLSHHIKNILQGIRGGSYLIETGLAQDNPDVVRKGWKIVDKNQNKISSLVMDMLTFSKEREPERATADMNEVVGEVVELVQSRAAEEGVALSWHPADDMQPFVFDPEAMHHAVLNVVGNALDAAAECPSGGRVAVRVEHDASAEVLRVVIEDNGPGIPATELKHLFSPFISTKGARGTGLGLPVSQKILAEHGGRIHVESSPEHGSRFCLELPAVSPAGPETSVS